MSDVIIALMAEIERLTKEGTPGVMHEIDRDFYDLTVQERDLERRRVDRLEAELKQLRNLVRSLPCYIQHTPEQWRLCRACSLRRQGVVGG